MRQDRGRLGLESFDLHQCSVCRGSLAQARSAFVQVQCVGVSVQLERALEMLGSAPALLVLSDGRPLSVLTRTDILSYFDARADY